MDPKTKIASTEGHNHLQATALSYCLVNIWKKRGMFVSILKQAGQGSLPGEMDVSSCALVLDLVICNSVQKSLTFI